MNADARFRRAMRAALAWATTTGWPTRSQDLAIAAEVFRKQGGPPDPLSEALLQALAASGNTDALRHRVLLCRLVLRAVEMLPPKGSGKAS